MNPNDYVKLAVNTEAPITPEMPKRLTEKRVMRLLHAGMGMCTEAGEFQDALKRHIFYGSKLDPVNLQEEVGDMLWYCALACEELDIDMAEVMIRNIEKLASRYPDRFKKDSALLRDLVAERKILEGEGGESK